MLVTGYSLTFLCNFIEVGTSHTDVLQSVANTVFPLCKSENVPWLYSMQSFSVILLASWRDHCGW